MIHARATKGPGEDSREEPSADAVVLKSNVKRTVLVERSGDARGGQRTTLVKRFHAPGLSRLRDRRRAHLEAGALSTALERGLPVPAVLGVALEDRRWSLRLEWIEGAAQLDEVLGHAPCRFRRVDLARRLGDLLACAERAGLRHPDPHAGNVLVDGGGGIWLVDLARARFGAADSNRFRSMLVRACARLRQITTPEFRALVHRGYLRKRTVPTPPPLATEIEAEARMQQLRDVAHRVDVWCRTSSATLEMRSESGQRVIKVRAAGDEAEAGWAIRRIAGDRRTVAHIWSTVVRATLHGLPTARPRALALAPPWFVDVDVPDTVGEVADPEHGAAFRSLLSDRGLVLDGEGLIDAEGRIHVGPAARLRSIEGMGLDD